MRKKARTRTEVYRPLRSGGRDHQATLDAAALYLPDISPYCDPHMTLVEVGAGRCGMCTRPASWLYTFRCLAHGDEHAHLLCFYHADRLVAYCDGLKP